MKLLFSLVFRKSDGTAYAPTDGEMKAMTLLKGGKHMHTMFEHVGDVREADTFQEAVEKIQTKLSDRTNKIVQRNMLLSNFPQGDKSFEKWSQQVSEAAKMIDYKNYDWRQAAVDAMILQTSSSKLREKALQENISYDGLLKIGIAKEQSEKGAAMLETASGHTRIEEEVRRLRMENEAFKSDVRNDRRRDRQRIQKTCTRCGSDKCSQGTKCAANGKQCSKCKKMNHFARACLNTRKTNTAGRLNDSDVSDSETSSRIIVAKIDNKKSTTNLETKVKVQGFGQTDQPAVSMQLITDSGVSKTIINYDHWNAIKSQTDLVKTSKGFRPYGTSYKLPIIGRAHVTLTAEAGAQISTWVYVVKDRKERSLLGKSDGERLGIIRLNPRGAPTEVVNRVSDIPKAEQLAVDAFDEDPKQANLIFNEFPQLFSNHTGKFKGEPVRIHVKPDAKPVIQATRRIPMHYINPLKKEIEQMLNDDIIEGPISIEEPGTFLSNLVIADKKDKRAIRVTLDCQAVNNEIHRTHEPIPTVEELRHKFKGSEVFSSLDMTNCYHQFEIEESARKLYAFRTPWGIYRYKRMVQGTSPASSEIQKRIRETIKNCPNAVHIKDDIVVHGTRDNHDNFLRQTLTKLQSKGITLRPDKCNLRKKEVKWFGFIFSKAGMSSDPMKCSIIKEWPRPKSGKEVKSFLQTVQFNAKFLGGSTEGDSYPVLTEPLRRLAKKHATFIWGNREQASFDEIKKRLCSERVMSPYDTRLRTRLYVDSSPTGTQATLAQLHKHKGEDAWKPVNHTSRAWTKAEAGYGQIERESNGILTGMTMNKMYTLGTHVEVVTDHKPLIPLYNNPTRPRNLRVDRHRTKLLPYRYTVIYEAGESSPCDYGSRHPPDHSPTKQDEEDWSIEDDTDIHVNRIITDSLPHAITRDELKVESKKDQSICQLTASIGKGHCPDSTELAPYRQVFTELWAIDGILMRNDQIVIPKSLRARVVESAHQGHQHVEKTMKLLRQTCWFPQMHKAVSEFVKSCIACNAASVHNPPVPLEPNFLPEGPWQKLHGDFKGPIAGSYYLHIIIDQYSKYPEVDVLTSTSFQKLKPVLDRIFSTHGVPETLTTDNGPPYSSDAMSEYSKHMGFQLTPVTPDDPQSNGFAENFVKQMCKLVHTAVAEKKDPRAEVHNYLLHYRATPHSTTEYSPAELLFGRRIKTKLPQIAKRQETDDMHRMRKQHDAKKMAQKHYFDKRYHAKEKTLNPGDKVLLKQRKTTTKSPYNPNPFIVTGVDGNRITMQNGAATRVRDKNKLKLITKRPAYLKTERFAERTGLQQEADIYIKTQHHAACQAPPMHVMTEAPGAGVEQPLTEEAHATDNDMLESSGAPPMHVMTETPGAEVEQPLTEEAHATDSDMLESSEVNAKEPISAHLAAPELVLVDAEEPSTVEPPAMESVCMEEHLQQLLRAAEEREQQDQEVDAAPAIPAPRRRGRPKKQVQQFRGNMRKKQGPSGD